MSESNEILLYFLPQSFPCGPQSACCGPVGQSDEEVAAYRSALEGALPGTTVATVNVSEPLDGSRDAPALKLLHTFGGAACPIFAVAGEVVAMGAGVPPDEIVRTVRARLAGVAAAG